MIGLFLKGFGWIRGFWATSHASNILLAVVVAYFGLQYYQGQKCRDNADIEKNLRQQVAKLSKQLVEQRNRDRDEAISEINEATDDCLDRPIGDILRDSDKAD